MFFTQRDEGEAGRWYVLHRALLSIKRAKHKFAYCITNQQVLEREYYNRPR